MKNNHNALIRQCWTGQSLSKQHSCNAEYEVVKYSQLQAV